MRVIFTEIAEETYENVLNFLALHWTEREIDTFVSDTEKLITQLKEGRILQFRKSGFNTRSALVGKRHIRVFFIQRNKDLINILLFFDTRQDPRKVPKLLGVKK